MHTSFVRLLICIFFEYNDDFVGYFTKYIFIVAKIDEKKFERLTDVELDSIIVQDDSRHLFKSYFNAYKKLQEKQLSKVTVDNDIVPLADVTNQIEITTAESVVLSTSPKKVTVDNENVESLIYAELSNVTHPEKENGSTNVDVTKSKPAEAQNTVLSYTEALEKAKQVDQLYSQSKYFCKLYTYFFI